MDLSVIPSINTGLSLAAFVAAALLYGYRARLKNRADIIKSAPPEQRLDAIATEAEFFRVDISGLRPKQQQEIVLAQIKLRERRELLAAVVVLAIAVLLAVTSIVAIMGQSGRPASANLLIRDMSVDGDSAGKNTLDVISFVASRAIDADLRNCRAHVSLIGSNRKTPVIALPKGTEQSNVEFATVVDDDGEGNPLEVFMTCDRVISNHLFSKVTTGMTIVPSPFGKENKYLMAE